MPIHADTAYNVGATVLAQPFYNGVAVGSPLSTTAFGSDGTIQRYGVDLSAIATPVDSVDFTVGGKIVGIASDVNWNGTLQVTNSVIYNNGPQGGNAVSINVKDQSANNIQGCSVSILYNGAQIAFVVTDANGNATAYLNNGSYTLIVTNQPGYVGSTSTIVVNGTTYINKILAPNTITPSVPPLVTGWLVALDGNNQPLAGVVHTLTLISAPSGTLGYSFTTANLTATSASNGLVQFANLFAGATYRLRAGTGDWVDVICSTTTFQLTPCYN